MAHRNHPNHHLIAYLTDKAKVQAPAFSISWWAETLRKDIQHDQEKHSNNYKASKVQDRRWMIEMLFEEALVSTIANGIKNAHWPWSKN